MRLPWLVLALLFMLNAGCLRPVPLRDEWVMSEVLHRYNDFFPAPSTQTPRAGLLRPRFGVPAIAQTGAAFPLELLEQSGGPSLRAALLAPDASPEESVRCLSGEHSPKCSLLSLVEKDRRPMSPQAAWVLYEARPSFALSPGGYDFVLSDGKSELQRSPQAVWFRNDNPETLSTLRVAHLSDLHVGKGDNRHSAEILARLFQVVTEVNLQQPDLVVVTGDLVHRGQISGMQFGAQQVLRHVRAPVLVILGNHDIEFGLFRAPVRRYGAGWVHFARAFHPFLHFSVSLGGYDFVGFDSGPAVRSFRILTRGLHRDSLDTLAADLNQAADKGRKGVVMFSHAPSRAALTKTFRPMGAGFFGRMDQGRAEFERLLIDGGRRGLQVLHLAGHTHWSDVFDLVPEGRRLNFRPWRDLSPCLRPLRTPVGIVTTQAASHAGVSGKTNARGYGFSVIELGGHVPRVATVQHVSSRATECAQNGAIVLSNTSAAFPSGKPRRPSASPSGAF
jgi:hypothetical protein